MNSSGARGLCHGSVDRRRLLGMGLGGGLVAAGLASGAGSGRRQVAAKEEYALFWARPQGARGELIAYSLESGEALFTLPAGMLAADDTRYLVADPQPETGDTWLKVYDPFTGTLVAGWLYVGDLALGGISATGRYVALTRVPTEEQRTLWRTEDRWETEVVVVDVDAGAREHRFTLPGNFEVEVLSAGGDALFLVEHLPPANPDHYAIRLYDLQIDALMEGRLVDKRDVDAIMAGLAWDSVASRDGTWLLTLYLSTNRNVAFVHTLNLPNRYPVCIDLPSGFGEFDLLKHYTQALAPDGRRLYAANPALGAVAVIDLNETRVVDVASFTPVDPARLATGDLRSRAAVGAGGRFAFTAGEDVWIYDAAADEVGAALPLPGPIIGLGLTPDDRLLLVARPGERLLALDPMTGAAVGFPIARR